MATHALDEDFAGLSQAAARASLDKRGENDFVTKEQNASLEVSEEAYDDGPTDVERETSGASPGRSPGLHTSSRASLFSFAVAVADRWGADSLTRSSSFIELVERFSYYGSTAVL